MFGCNIVMVMGITDVDDKIIRRAAEVSAEDVIVLSLDGGVCPPPGDSPSSAQPVGPASLRPHEARRGLADR